MISIKMEQIENNLTQWWPKLAAATEPCGIEDGVDEDGVGVIQLIFRDLNGRPANFWLEVSILKFVISNEIKYKVSVNSSISSLYNQGFDKLPHIEEFLKALRFAMESYNMTIDKAYEMLLYLEESTSVTQLIA